METLQRLNDIAKKISAENRFSEYLKFEREIYEAIQTAPSNTKIRVALLASFTVKPTHLYLTIQGAVEGMTLDVYVADYNMLMQEILDQNSGLYAFNPEVTFCFARLDDFLPDPTGITLKGSRLAEIVDRIVTLRSRFSERNKSLFVFGNFIIPVDFPFSVYPEKENVEVLHQLNKTLTEAFLGLNNACILDLESLAQYHGKQNTINPLLYFSSDIYFSDTFMPLVARKMVSAIKAFKEKPKKCIVLDCDNTLWGGIVGELGLENISLSHHGRGSEYYEFQKLIKSLLDRGVILAINSKNNLNDIMETLDNHPHMLLRSRHFASIQANWENKADNMAKIAKELNIGLDSLIFLDDDPAQRKLIRDLLPEVKVIDLPKNPVQYYQTIQNLADFEQIKLTWEDKNRGNIYAAQKERKILEQNSQSFEEYLKSLQTVIQIAKAGERDISRLSQLTLRTNQFNLTTKRHSESDIKEFLSSPDFEIYLIKAKDIFGDNGMVGMAILRDLKNAVWEIDSFMLSCRVIGRFIEDAFLNYILAQGVQSSVQLVTARYIASAKNSQTRDFYQKNGFSCICETPQEKTYELKLNDFREKSFTGIRINAT